MILESQDLWPVRINPKNVLVKFPLSPEYIREYLAEDEVELLEGKSEKDS